MTGKILAAGIDVFEEENYIKEEVENLLEQTPEGVDLKLF